MLANAIVMPLGSVRRVEWARTGRLRPVEVPHRLYGGILVIEIVSGHDIN